MSGWKASVLHSSKPGRRQRRRRRLQARSITPALLPVGGQLTPTAHRPSVYHVRAKPKSSPTTKNVTELEPGNVMTTPTRDGNKFSSLNPRLPSSHTFISRYSLVDICAVERRRNVHCIYIPFAVFCRCPTLVAITLRQIKHLSQALNGSIILM